MRQVTASLIAMLMLIATGDASFAQRPLCSQYAETDRARARAAGLCRDPAPIIDVPPKSVAPEPAGAIPVPHVLGLSFDEAQSRLNRFTVQRVYRAAAEPGGTVLSQSPASPALPAGSPVTLVLSDGSLVRVPRVTSININDARQRLQEVDVRPQPVVVTSDQRVGTVIGQQPPEGTVVKRGSVVRLDVSAGQEGPEQIDVPNVVGLPFDRARARLARFTVERVDRPRSEQSDPPEGQVIEQMPRSATRAPAGAVVVLTVASPPRAVIEVFEMPNVVGRSFAEASRALAEFQITRTEADSSSQRGQVLAQSPAAGTALRPGDAVALQVSAGKSASASAVAGVGVAPDSDAGNWRAVLAIGGGVLLGLIGGALVMRQWLLHRQASAAADGAIASMTPRWPGAENAAPLSTVDILLEESVPDFAAKQTSPPARHEQAIDVDRDDQPEAAEASPRPLDTNRDSEQR